MIVRATARKPWPLISSLLMCMRRMAARTELSLIGRVLRASFAETGSCSPCADLGFHRYFVHRLDRTALALASAAHGPPPSADRLERSRVRAWPYLRAACDGFNSRAFGPPMNKGPEWGPYSLVEVAGVEPASKKCGMEVHSQAWSAVGDLCRG